MREANIVFNSFTNDSRVIKEATSLTKNNYSVEGVVHFDKNLEKTKIQNNIKSCVKIYES